MEISTALDPRFSTSFHRFPHALPRFARPGPDRSISITSLHHSKHQPYTSLLHDTRRYRPDRIHCLETTTIRPLPSSRTIRLPQMLDV